MRAIDLESNDLISIYGFYHYNVDYYFYGICDGGNTLSAFKQKDIKITEPEINFDTLYFGSDGKSYFMLLHWALAENNLLDRVLDRDPDALEDFEKLRFCNKRS